MHFPKDNFTLTTTGTMQVPLAGNIAAIELIGAVGTVARIDYRGPSGNATAITLVTMTVSSGTSELFLSTVDWLAGYYDIVLTTLPSGTASVQTSYQAI